jgi:hypothetical protein
VRAGVLAKILEDLGDPVRPATVADAATAAVRLHDTGPAARQGAPPGPGGRNLVGGTLRDGMPAPSQSKPQSRDGGVRNQTFTGPTEGEGKRAGICPRVGPKGHRCAGCRLVR